MNEIKISPAAREVLDIIDSGAYDDVELRDALEDGEALTAWGFTDKDIPAIEEAYEFLGNWGAIVNLMDNETREAVHRDLAPCTLLEFWDEYESRHLKKFGKPFELN